ncbi:hypothetical protein DL766_001081 [Monosporascus sp. MC13-8B]|nr:hypothetical protein DL766_001081 [Monosporascus sp. MC13-8B]
MDGTSFFAYAFQGDDGNEFTIFNNRDTNVQTPYLQEQLTSAYSEDTPLNLPSPATHQTGSSSMPSRNKQISPTPTNDHMPSRLWGKRLAMPQAESSKLQSPGLSRGSPTTPETRSSGRLVTPEDHPRSRQKKTDGVPRVISFQPYVPLARRKRQRSQKSQEGVSPVQEETKRNRFLEKNRIAATKCRQKKKEWMSDLEETRSGLESQNAQLRMECNGLLDEVSRLRIELMQHASCNDPNIDKWVENEAKRFVLTTGERYDQMLAEIGASQRPDHRADSMSSAPEYQAPGEITSPPAGFSHRDSMAPSQLHGLPPNPQVFYHGNIALSLPSRTNNHSEAEAGHQSGILPVTGASENVRFGQVPVST